MIEPDSPRPAGPPWEEARGPHLPDSLIRIPPLAWVFIVLSTARLWSLIDEARYGSTSDLDIAANVVANAVGEIAVLLTPAVLVIRDRDVAKRAPVLFGGFVLVAIGSLLQAVSLGLFLLAIDDADSVSASALVLGFTVLVSLIGVVGLFAIGRGLNLARRLPNRGGSRGRTILLIFTAYLVVSRLADAYRTMPSSPDATYAVYSLAAIATSVAGIVAWAYLVVATLNGVRAGETPSRAWRIGVVAGVMALLAYVLFAVLAFIVGPATDYTDILLLASALFSIGPAMLLVAVVAGLPSLEPRAEPAPD
jgi:hypothetical protein